MATYVKYNQFVLDVCSGVHQLQTGTTHVLKIALTNTAPNVASHTVRGNIAEITAGNGYPAGGTSVGTVTGSGPPASGTFKCVGATDPVFTAAGGPIGPFRYAVLYNDTPTSPPDPLIAYWDYGSPVTLNDGDSFTVNIDQANGLFTMA